MQLSNTDNNFKFLKGDWVIVSKTDHDVKYTAKIIDSQFELKEVIYTVELYGGMLRFPESALIHQNPDDERDWKLKKLLK